MTKPPLGFPTALAQDCKETPTKLETNADLVFKVRDLRSDLKACSADKQALRQWAADNRLTPADTPDRP